jgi:hypothetical protein
MDDYNWGLVFGIFCMLIISIGEMIILFILTKYFFSIYSLIVSFSIGCIITIFYFFFIFLYPIPTQQTLPFIPPLMGLYGMLWTYVILCFIEIIKNYDKIIL